MFLMRKNTYFIVIMLFSTIGQVAAHNLVRLVRLPSQMVKVIDMEEQGKNSLEKAYVVTRYLSANEQVGTVYQLVMEFSNSINCEKECNADRSEIKLYFPGMKKEDLERTGFQKQCEKISFVKSVDITQETHPVSRAVVALSFKLDSAVVKVQKRASPHVLTIDCYEKNILNAIKNSTDVYRMAYDAASRQGPPSSCCIQKTNYCC